MTEVKERGGPQVLPFYILCDASTSMRNGRIDSVNEGLPEIHRVIATDPVVSEKCRLGVISFSTEATVDLPLCDVSRVSRMPTLRAGGQTRFANAIRVTRNLITQDIENLRSNGNQVYRPVVFFITDGRPTGGWKTERDHWIDHTLNPFAPHIIGFGVAEADEGTLRRLSTQFSFVANEGVSPAVALREILGHIASSIVASTRHPEGGLIIPATSENFRMIDGGMT